MSNTVPSIGKHLLECDNFKITYLDQIDYVKENIKARKQRTAELRTANNLKKQMEQRKIFFFYLLYNVLIYFYFYILSNLIF